MLKNYDELHNETNMLTGNINHMCVTKDTGELDNQYSWALKRLERIHEYNLKRLSEKSVSNK